MNVVILDTGCANLASLKWAIKRLGFISKISKEYKVILKADKLFLPGVGTAKTVMQQLKRCNLIPLIKSYTNPMLGICLGMQLFGHSSCENNGIKTLNIINEPVTIIKTQNLPLPHMGWNKVFIKNKHYLFRDIPNKSYFYFAHNYIMSVNINTIAQCEYSLPFSAALQKDNFFGVQFHPERSGEIGAQLLKNFLEM
ncbi:imidazole glycerol phosphate synthase subunit HisH [Pantoea sp. Mhis]|uniref:imidazole glycerol phosphate synthase subunit HisH n=1 Tax=Pantoea sp. Mhis TaxID=2576759 RepID=UPI001356F4B6|nr:imidazole glycerol phosphate synthase subunit HisH [Pantoea sp. Mhis]MXP56161.1 imidazole glycerol phosphate synthase subunit HisH [Pantoea sp. Mhis]